VSLKRSAQRVIQQLHMLILQQCTLEQQQQPIALVSAAAVVAVAVALSVADMCIRSSTSITAA
jgi:hypothetical protein